MKEDWLDNSLGDKLDGYESPLDLEKLEPFTQMPCSTFIS